MWSLPFPTPTMRSPCHPMLTKTRKLPKARKLFPRYQRWSTRWATMLFSGKYTKFHFLVQTDLYIHSLIEEDGEINVKCYNDELANYPEEDRKWGTMNWLFAECYLWVGWTVKLFSALILESSYRRLRSYFALTQHWKSYDPFFDQKAETYKSSSGAILREWWIAWITGFG